MSAVATIRELRLNFRSVKKKIEEHQTIIITDNGVPSYQLTALKPVSRKAEPLPDYYARLLAQKSKLSPAEAESLHADNRGNR
jgi:antitoxin (DNA-binding transcriptional repressor) of toxin-antitoxin stability system